MSQPSTLATAVRAAVRFDRASVSWTAGLLGAVPVVATLGIPIAAGDPVAGVTMGVGAMLVGIAWRTTGGRPPRAVMFADSVLMGIATFIGCVTGEVLWVHLLALAALSLGAGLLVAIGNRGAALGTQAILAVIVFGRFNEPAAQAIGLAGLVFAGGAAQVLFLSIVRWPPPLVGQRRATAAAYRELARLALGTADTPSLPAGAALDEAEKSLANGSLLGDSAVLTLRSIVDEGRRIRIGLIALNSVAGRLTPNRAETATVHELADAVAATLRQAADTIEHGRGSAELLTLAGQVTATIHRLVTEEPAGARGDAVWVLLTRRLAGLGGQLRAIASLAPAAGRGGGLLSRRVHATTLHPLSVLRSDLEEIRANLSLQSPATRHGLRLAVVVPIATLIARQLPVHHGYWVAVAAATVLRPEYGATFTRGTERAGGTALGVALAGLIAVAFHPAGGATIALVGLFAVLGYATMPASFAVGYGFITSLVVFLLNALDPDTLSTATSRLVDTLIGAAIGLFVYAVWPTWSRNAAQSALAELVEAIRRYAMLVLDAVVEGTAVAPDQARDIARAARLARTRAEADVARSLGEPPSHRIDDRVGPGMLGEARRLVQATHVLRLDVQETPDPAPEPHFAPLVRALDIELAAVARALASDDLQLSSEYTDPRAIFDRIAREPADEEGRVLLADLDHFVDAVNAVAELVARAPEPPIASAATSGAGTAAAASR